MPDRIRETFGFQNHDLNQYIMFISLIHFFRSLMLNIHLLLQCLVSKPEHFRKKAAIDVELSKIVPANQRNRKKPEWVVQEVIRLKALMHYGSYRDVAYTFNRLHEHKREMTVSKSWVGSITLKNKHAIYLKRKEIKSKPARSYPANHIWSIDLTTLTDEQKHQHIVFGIIDGGTRANLLLKRISNKKSSTLVLHILDTIKKYGKPAKIRTDNESVFISRLFRTALKLLRIKHQLTEIACPWMNGRIERFFGTLKRSIHHIVIKSSELDTRLTEFRFYYNHVRPHQNLNNKTPAEAWGKHLRDYKKLPQEILLWQGVLAGYYWDY